MSEQLEKRSNDERWVQPLVRGAAKAGRELAAYAREHPDEVAVGLAPLTALFLATRRHRLGAAESVLVTEVGYWCGVLLVREFRAWKARPAGPAPRLRKVI
ncbi:MAG: hypothetical protein ACLP5E_22730 [Streptosporangiaceae bacterium]